MRHEIARKSVHATLAVAFAVSAVFFIPNVFLSIVLSCFVLFAVLRVVRLRTIFHGVLRVSYGELFFMIGVAGAYILSDSSLLAFQVGMLVLALADPFAALVGMRFGKHTYTIFDEKRSFEGSFACIFVAVCIFFACGMPLLLSCVAGILLALIDAVSLRGSDNLFLPTLATLLFRYFV